MTDLLCELDLYERALAAYQIDDCEQALKYLGSGNDPVTSTPRMNELRNLIRSRVAHTRSPEAYLEVYEYLAEEGGMAPIAWDVWRVQWMVSRVAALALKDLATSLLDIGCQKGQITTWYGRLPLYNVVGVDISPTNIRDARTNPANTAIISYQVADAEDLPFDDDQFDISVLASVLEHVRDPHKTLDEAHRVTRPGGNIFIHVPYGGYGYWTLEIAKREGNEEWLARPFQEHVRFWDPLKHLRHAHMEIEYNDLTGDTRFPFACQGEDVGEWCIMLRVK